MSVDVSCVDCIKVSSTFSFERWRIVEVVNDVIDIWPDTGVLHVCVLFLIGISCVDNLGLHIISYSIQLNIQITQQILVKIVLLYDRIRINGEF